MTWVLKGLFSDIFTPRHPIHLHSQEKKDRSWTYHLKISEWKWVPWVPKSLTLQTWPLQFGANTLLHSVYLCWCIWKCPHNLFPKCSLQNTMVVTDIWFGKIDTQCWAELQLSWIVRFPVFRWCIEWWPVFENSWWVGGEHRRPVFVSPVKPKGLSPFWDLFSVLELRCFHTYLT